MCLMWRQMNSWRMQAGELSDNKKLNQSRDVWCDSFPQLRTGTLLFSVLESRCATRHCGRGYDKTAHQFVSTGQRSPTWLLHLSWVCKSVSHNGIHFQSRMAQFWWALDMQAGFVNIKTLLEKQKNDRGSWWSHSAMEHSWHNPCCLIDTRMYFKALVLVSQVGAGPQSLNDWCYKSNKEVMH